MANNVYVQRTFRFVADDGSESGSTLLGANGDDRSVTIGIGNRIRIRFVIEETANSKTENISPNLYYNLNSGGWNDVDNTSSPVRAVTSQNTSWTITDGDATTERLGYTSGGPTWVAGIYCDDAAADHTVALRYTYTEIEFCIYLVDGSISNNDSIQLRVHDGAAVFSTYDDIPVITALADTTDVLTANDVTSGTPTLDAPAIAQIHALTASDVTSGTPTLDSPSLAEIVSLSASDVNSGTPTFGAPTLAVIHNLSALDVTSGTPTLGPPTLTVPFYAKVTWLEFQIPLASGVHSLSAPDLTSGTPTLDTPTISQTHALSASDVTSGTPTLDTPTISQANQLSASDVTSGVTTVDDAVIGQIHSLSANDVTSGTPTLDAPIISTTGVDGLNALDLYSGTPTVDNPTLITDVVYGVDETNWFFSPTNWYKSGSTYAITNSPGAYMKLAFTGTGLSMTINLSLFTATGPNASDYPYFKWRTDGGSWQKQITTNGQTTFTFETGLSNTSHTIEIYFESIQRNRDRWLNPSASIRVDNVTVENGGGLTAPTLASERWLVFGDSRVEGVNTYGDSYANADQGGARTWAIQIGETQGAEVGSIGWVSQGFYWPPPTNSNVPRFNDTGTGENSWTEIFNGVSRSFTGIDTILVNIGVNDEGLADATTKANIIDFLTDIRTAAPTARVILLIPFYNEVYASSLFSHVWSDAVQTYIDSSSDTNVFLTTITGMNTTLDYDLSWQTPTTYSIDGGHPNQAGHDEIASLLNTVLNNDILIAHEITSGTPTLGTPTLSESNLLSANDVTSGTPTVDDAVIAQIHSLTASDVTSSVPTLDSPTIAQVHALTANDVTSGVPTLDTPTITEVHSLSASDVTSGVPTLDSPTIAQTHPLTASDVTSGVPTLDNPTISQVHSLTATDVTSGIPTLDSPTIAQVHALTATEVTSGVPTLDTPSLSHIHNLNAADVVSGAPTIDSPSIGQTHSLTANDVTSGVPTYDAPTLGTFGEDALTANDVSTTATLDSPTLGQTHDLTASDVTSGVPTYDAPTIQQIVDLTANDVTSGVPTYDAPSIGQVHVLTASDITSGVPTVDSPTIGQVHALTASDVTSGAWTRDLPTLEEPRFLRPDTDISTGTWQSTEATFHDAVNETVVDNDTYIYSEADPTASQVELGFSNASDPESTSFHIVNYVSHKVGTGTASVTYYLMQGAVQIATWTDNDISETPTMRSYELSVAEINSITDYNDLRIIAEATVT